MSIKGRENVRRYLLQVAPKKLAALAKGAARAGGEVIRDDAKEKCPSEEVREALKTKVSTPDPATTRATVYVKGAWEKSVANWLERGTSPHFISVDDSVREGRSAGRINRLDKAAGKEGRAGPGRSLVIGGKPVGTTVHHPGATPHPFLRPALDHSYRAAVAAAQAYIDQKAARGSPAGPDDGDD